MDRTHEEHSIALACLYQRQTQVRRRPDVRCGKPSRHNAFSGSISRSLTTFNVQQMPALASSGCRIGFSTSCGLEKTVACKFAVQPSNFTTSTGTATTAVITSVSGDHVGTNTMHIMNEMYFVSPTTCVRHIRNVRWQNRSYRINTPSKTLVEFEVRYASETRYPWRYSFSRYYGETPRMDETGRRPRQRWSSRVGTTTSFFISSRVPSNSVGHYCTKFLLA